MGSSAQFDIGTLITSTPGVYGGQPCLAGTRFPVSLVAAYAREGAAGILELFEAYPWLDQAKVYAAVAYYLANQNEFELRFNEERQLWERLEAEGW
jgi:uncharacterized protein (DUF433 family)